MNIDISAAKLRLSLTFCGGHVKEKGQAIECFTAPLCLFVFRFFFFFKFALPFLWLNAAENWAAWQSRGGCFRRSRVRMEHIPGKSCVNPSIDLVRNPPDLWNTLAD